MTSAFVLLSHFIFLVASQSSIGYYNDNGGWTELTCGPGLTFTTTSTAGSAFAGCIPTSPTGSLIAEYSESTSLRVVTPGLTYPCPEPTTACITFLLYSDLDLGVPTTLLDCFGSEIGPISLFRATTYESASAATTSTSQTPTSTTTSVSGSTSSQTAQQSSTHSTTNSPTSQSLSSTTNTTSSSLTTSTPNSSTQTNSSNSNSNNGSNNQNSSDNEAIRIGLGTGLGLGIPALLIALGALLYPIYRRSRTHKPTNDEKYSTGTQQMSPAPPDPPSVSEVTPAPTLYTTPLPPGTHGNPAEMDTRGYRGYPVELEHTNPVGRSELGVDRWESNIGGIGCG